MRMWSLYQSVLTSLSVLPSWRSIPRKLWKSWGHRIISWQITQTPTSTSMSAQTSCHMANEMHFHVVDVVYIRMPRFVVVSCSTLSGLVEFDGFYLESDPCLVCNNPEVPFSVRITQVQLMQTTCSHEERMKNFNTKFDGLGMLDLYYPLFMLQTMAKLCRKEKDPNWHKKVYLPKTLPCLSSRTLNCHLSKWTLATPPRSRLSSSSAATPSVKSQ